MTTMMTAAPPANADRFTAATLTGSSNAPLAEDVRALPRRMGLSGVELTLLGLILFGLFLAPLLTFVLLHWRDEAVFRWGRRFISLQRASILTITLIAGSGFATASLHLLRRGARRTALALLSMTVLAAAGFAIVTAIDIEAKARYGLLPGASFRPRERYLARRFGVTLESVPAIASVAVTPVAVPPAEPNVERGRSIFLGTCSTCHARSGEGLPGYGKDLRISTFVAERDVDKLAAFLKVGRQPWDPLNTTKVQMPPRGGNPMLTDDCLRDVAAFVHELQRDFKAAATAPPGLTSGGPTGDVAKGEAGGTASGISGNVSGAPSSTNPADDPLLARSVIPFAVDGPPGLAAAYVAQLHRPRWAAPESAESFFAAHVLTTTLFAIQLLATAAGAVWLLIAVARTRVPVSPFAPILAIGVAWWWLTATWLVLFPVAYFWT